MTAGNGHDTGPGLATQARVLIATCSSYTEDEPPDVLAAALADCLQLLEQMADRLDVLNHG